MKHAALAVVIPAYNEAATVACVVAGARCLGDVIVVDDGSFDGTAQLASMAGAQVINLSGNMGYEAALSTGLQHAVNAQYEFALTMDADGQHRTESAQALIDALGSADVAIGIRRNKARVAERVAGWVGALLWRVSDPFSGLKLYRLCSCKALLPFDSYCLAGGEMFVRAYSAGLRLTTMPIEVEERTDGSRFGISWRANYRLARATALMVAISLRLV
ncbi:MAG: glycosyltransferase family 2 protein [Actinobacteria bacterium]|nr:glycosyltransferase family 2 protein [Actinomycetota bacterium]